jgi:hypothetical protein
VPGFGMNLHNNKIFRISSTGSSFSHFPLWVMRFWKDALRGYVISFKIVKSSSRRLLKDFIAPSNKRLTKARKIQIRKEMKAVNR